MKQQLNNAQRTAIGLIPVFAVANILLSEYAADKRTLFVTVVQIAIVIGLIGCVVVLSQGYGREKK
jgi:hypothetical protein